MYVNGAQWFTANYNEVSAVLKDVRNNYKKYTLKSKKLSKVNSSLYSLDKMTIELDKILDKYVPKFAKKVELKLPKLKKVGQTNTPEIKLPKLKKV